MYVFCTFVLSLGSRSLVATLAQILFVVLHQAGTVKSCTMVRNFGVSGCLPWSPSSWHLSHRATNVLDAAFFGVFGDGVVHELCMNCA